MSTPLPAGTLPARVIQKITSIRNGTDVAATQTDVAQLALTERGQSPADRIAMPASAHELRQRLQPAT